MKNYLEQYFGCEVEVYENKDTLPLPIYLTMRQIYIVVIAGVRFALVNITKETTLSIATMKKQQKKYEEVLSCPVAFDMVIESTAMRNALVINGIPFIDIPGNIYLPFLGIVLQEVYTKQRIRSDKMMPATQMLFLELMYMDDDQTALKSEVARKLDLTKTSITRATAQLEEMGLICQNKSGTEISIKRNMSKKDYYTKAKKYLINPVQKIITTNGLDLSSNIWHAGETALSQISDLNPPRIVELAIYKGDESVKKLNVVDERLIDKECISKIQLWKYNPSTFANDGRVDMVSLACSFMGNKDERIEMCIETLMEEL